MTDINKEDLWDALCPVTTTKYIINQIRNLDALGIYMYALSLHNRGIDVSRSHIAEHFNRLPKHVDKCFDYIYKVLNEINMEISFTYIRD